MRILIRLVILVFLHTLICIYPAYADTDIEVTPSAYSMEPVNDTIYLRLDVSNKLDLTTNDFHIDTNTYYKRISNEEFRFYIAGTLVHTWSISAPIAEFNPIVSTEGNNILSIGGNQLVNS